MATWVNESTLRKILNVSESTPLSALPSPDAVVGQAPFWDVSKIETPSIDPGDALDYEEAREYILAKVNQNPELYDGRLSSNFKANRTFMYEGGSVNGTKIPFHHLVCGVAVFSLEKINRYLDEMRK